MTIPTATGRRDDRDGEWVVFTRTFDASMDVVWAAVTEPERLERWIGTWTGDPRSGTVTFTMTAEGEDVPPEPYDIEECEPPRRLRLSTTDDDGTTWRLRMELSEADGVTTLDFAQQLTDPELAAHVGPGWDYYLDRLVAAVDGADPARIDFEAYYPNLSDHYRALLG